MCTPRSTRVQFGRTSSVARPPSVRCRATLLTRLALVPIVLALSGCGGLADLVTPGTRATQAPATIAFTATVPRSVATATDVVTLSVTASYLRQNAARVRIGAQVMSLTTAALQSVPIPVDVATCLADPLRDGGNSAPTASCAVVLNLALMVNGGVVDEQEIGPLRLSPGGTSTVQEPVTLIDLASVEVVDGGGAIVPPGGVMQASLGSALTVSARVRDTRGQAVTDRSVIWSSDAPAVATVDATTGVVTAVALGAARLTARIGALSAAAELRVLKAPSALTINVGTGSGAGRITSTPQGIDCQVVGAALSGACSFSFPGDAAVVLASVPAQGSVFTSWGDACLASSVGANCQVLMSEARVASVRFSALRLVTVAAGTGGDGRGRVTGAGGLDCRLSPASVAGSCSVQVPEGTPYQLRAAGEPLPTGGTQQFFAGWGGVCENATADTCVVTPGSANLSASAKFLDARAVTVMVAGAGGGLVTGGSTIVCTRNAAGTSGTCNESATFGTAVTLTALPDAQSAFTGWTGDCSGQSATCTTTLTQARAVEATFARRQVVLNVAMEGPGGGTVALDGTSVCTLAINQPATTCTRRFDAGTRVVVTATAAGGSRFVGFGSACNGTGACTVTVNEDATVIATFAPTKYPLTVTMTGTGAGSVVASDGEVCTSSLNQTSVACTRLVDFGTTVRLSATPTVESNFDGFSGDCVRGGACAVTVTGARTVAATFSRKQVQLLVRMTGTGAGALTLNGAPVCALTLNQGSNSCIRLVDYGAVLPLIAVPSPESEFQAFGGDCPTSASCTPTVTAATTVSVSFKRRQFPLTVSLSGSGAGSVSVDGAVACALTQGQITVSCALTVDAGATLAIVAAANAGSSFEGFSGDCAGTAPCTIVVRGPAALNARIMRQQVQLTVQLSGTGGGTVSGNGTALCTLAVGQNSASCTKLVDVGTPIALAATSNVGSAFVGFSNGCSPSTACTIVPTGPVLVGARFDVQAVPLSISLTGTGGGAVNVNGAVACALTPGQATASCTSTYPYGTVVNLSATPSGESTSDGLHGDCPNSSSCTLTLTSARSVSAEFVRSKVLLTLNLTGLGGGVLTVNSSAACTLAEGQGSASCSRWVDIGSTVNITVVAFSGSSLETLGSDCAGTAPGVPTCTISMTSARTVSARIARNSSNLQR